MNITALIHKIHNDYSNPNYLINNTLRYQFDYNGYTTDLYYTKQNGLEQLLRLIVRVGNVDYLIVEHFSLHNNDYEIQTYLDPEIYKALKFTLLYVDNKCATTPYFETMKNKIINSLPIVDANPQRNYYHHNNDVYKPFFETIVRKPMSAKMRERIKNCYRTDVANRILKYCGRTQTLRFTTDISKAKNIEVYFASLQPINPQTP